MRRRTVHATALLLGLALAGQGLCDAGETAGQAPPPKAEEGGAKLGFIKLDRPNKRFSVPGQVLRREPPLEYAVVAKGGMKAYEALLELDTSGAQFNLACLLIGLDGAKARAPEHQFDARPVDGDPVRISVTWTLEGAERRSTLAELFQVAGKSSPPDEWVYTGSLFTPDGKYLPELTGNLVGIVHDPASVIEHRAGVGIGGYGSVGADASRCPPAGTPITLTVERAAP